MQHLRWPFVSEKHELLQRDPVDLAPLEAMARDYFVIHDSLYDVDERDRLVMLDAAERFVREEIGGRLLFLCSLYAVSEEGSTLCEPDLLGTIKQVTPTGFLEVPTDVARSPWHANGLGIIVEPVDDAGCNTDLPIMGLHGWGSMWSELTFPLNNNVVLAARAPVIACERDP